MASSNLFSDLLQRADKLSSVASGDELQSFPKVPRNLDEIFEQGERLWKKTANVGATEQQIGAERPIAPAEGSFLLPGIEKQPEVGFKRQFDGKPSFDGTAPIETDLEGYLRRERENILMSLVEETVQQTIEAIERRQREAVTETWEQRKKKLLADTTAPGDVTMKDYAAVTEERPAVARTGMNDIEMVFARQVAEYTDKLLHNAGIKSNLVDALVSASQSLRGEGYPVLWEQVQCMIQIPVQTDRPLLEQRMSQRFKRSLVENALAFLERQFLKHMEAIVYGHVEQARRSGVPGTYPLVNAYLNVKMPVPYPGCEDGTVENHPVWAVIYYCLRSGDFGAAATACEAAGPQLTEFAGIFRESRARPHEELSSEIKTRLNVLYRRHVRGSHDPYKRAVFIVMALCDTTVEDPEIVDTLQNWLWYRLRQVRLYEMSSLDIATPSKSTGGRTSGASLDNASLSFLQKQILEDYGERHFIAGDSQYLFWDALWLTGQFEAAIDYICRQSDVLRCHGVHIALAAHEMGLLLIPEDMQAKLCSADRNDPPLVRRLNLVRLVLLYIFKFQNRDTRDAVNYLYFLRDIKSPKGEDMFCVTLADLVMETGEFEMMLGSINPNGTRKPGIVDKFSFNAERLIEQVAREHEQKGLNEKAVQLYDLATKHTKALELLNEMLVKICCDVPGASGEHDTTAQIALEIAKRYRELGCKTDPETQLTFHMLMDLVTFFDLYHANAYSEAIEVMRELKLVPLDMNSVNQYVKTFYRLAEPIRRLLPQILLALMSILLTEYRRVKGYMTFPGTVTGNVEAAEALKNSARALVTYIGMIPFCMPGDTTARLVQMEVLMH